MQVQNNGNSLTPRKNLVAGVIATRLDQRSGDGMFKAISRTLLAIMMLATSSNAFGQSSREPTGLVMVKSTHPFDETVSKLEQSLVSRTQTIFAKIDHQKNATGVGLGLRPTTLIVFGNPKGGTPLMQSRQTIGIDLPMKYLVTQDAGGSVYISYNDPEWLGRRHRLLEGSMGAIKAISAFLAENAKAAAN